jgi:DNA-binding CsgD family transcriptional regulator
MVEPVGPGPSADWDDVLADIGDRIRAERQARGWSLHRLSRDSRISVATLKRLEAGAGSLRVFAQACTGLGVSMAYLLSEDWKMPAPKRGHAGGGGTVRLSPRQTLVLHEAALGGSLSQICARLGLSSGAAGSALSQVYQRLGVASLPLKERRAAAVRVAMEHGLITPKTRTS